jgi:hypothetical protein
LTDTIKHADVTKWLDRLEPVIEEAEALDAKGEEVITNAKAYVADCRHWLESGNLVLAFECMVHSWAIMETARELGAVSFEVPQETL